MKLQIRSLVALMGCCLAAGAGGALAGNSVNLIPVTTTNDSLDAFDQACSLREAILNANGANQFSPVQNECPEGRDDMTNVIVLQDGQTYSLTIPGNGYEEGDLDILSHLFTDMPHLRIESDGATGATIRQTVGGQRILVNQGADVELVNITLREGSPNVGGAIMNNEGKLRLERVSLIANSATSGGAIYNDGGQINLVDSQLVLNTASLLGGAILNEGGGQIVLSNTQIRANTAVEGGGVYNTGAQLTVGPGSSINLNTATSGNGGGVSSVSGSSLTVNGASFEGNRAQGGPTVARGGAIHHHSTQTLQVANALFSSNQARLGGAIHIPNDTPLQVSGSEFIDNLASTDGGALHAVFLGVTNSRFERNQAVTSGGAALVQAVGGFVDSTFEENEAAEGGAIKALNLELVNSEFSRNEAFGAGGAVSIADSGLIDRSRFFDNVVSGMGGGLYVHDIGGTGNITTISRSLFTGNEAGDGGGLYLRSVAAIANTTIFGNAGTNGGGIHIHAQGDVTALNMTLLGHLAGQDLYKMGILRMGNSILATPGQPDCLGSLDHPTIITLGNNLRDDAASDPNSCSYDQVLASDISGANPMTDELADNGGGTLTLALLPGSPAIDAGNNILCAGPLVNNVDQRGAARPMGAACDIGAHEQGSEAPSVDAIFFDGFE